MRRRPCPPACHCFHGALNTGMTGSSWSRQKECILSGKNREIKGRMFPTGRTDGPPCQQIRRKGTKKNEKPTWSCNTLLPSCFNLVLLLRFLYLRFLGSAQWRYKRSKGGSPSKYSLTDLPARNVVNVIMPPWSKSKMSFIISLLFWIGS